MVRLNLAMVLLTFMLFQVYITAGKFYDLEKKLQKLEETSKSRYFGTTHSELSKLEDKVAQAATTVQNTESEVQAQCMSVNMCTSLCLC